MITNEEKISIINNRINNLNFIIESFINNYENLNDKYSLEEELINCNFEKNILLQLINSLE